MKIGILTAGLPLPDGLIDSLKAGGADTETFVIHPGKPLDQAGSFLERADLFDLVHNLSGGVGLLLAQMSGALTVSTVRESLTEEEKAVFRAMSGRAFFVSEKGPVGPMGLRGIPGLAPFDGDRARFYLDAYSRIVAMGKRRENRPWGSYEVLSDDCGDHKVKRIVVKPGKRLSLQFHGRRREHWVVVSGQALVTVGEEKQNLGPSESIDIPRRAPHRVENTGTEDLVFIEVQQGDYFGEDDIFRLEDDFGRI